eukprot:4965789-Prymnesium_polylepis.1
MLFCGKGRELGRRGWSGVEGPRCRARRESAQTPVKSETGEPSQTYGGRRRRRDARGRCGRS